MNDEPSREEIWRGTIDLFDRSFQVLLTMGTTDAEAGDGRPMTELLRRIEELTNFYNECTAAVGVHRPIAQA